MTPRTKRTPQKPQKKKQPKKRYNNYLTLKNLSITIAVLFVFIVTFSLLFIDQKEETVKQETKKEIDDKKYNQIIEEKMTQYISDGKLKFEEHTDEFQKDYIQIKEEAKKKEEILENKIEKIKEEILQTLSNKDEESKKLAQELVKKIDKEIAPIISKDEEQKPKTFDPNKPKMAIIIDDVSYKYQVKSILDIGYKVNMSFLPPTPRHDDSAKLAQKLPSYMVHLPLQASSFSHEEKDTLHIGDTLETIDKRIQQIRNWYPQAKYINNHTGSKFTADEKSMDILMQVLKKYDFKFIDSRTTAQTVAQKYAQKYGVEFYSRNIFLDNQLEYEYIQGQLKKAVAIAHKTGFSIAIGHPHEQTIKVLKNSKNLLKNIELIYVDQL